MTDTILEIEEISLAFSGVQALQNVSLTLPDSSILAVIGPNGAGKTSLFNCISGVYRPQSGRIRIGGVEISNLSPHAIARLGVARMFQNLAIFEHLTVLENMLLGRHHLYRSRWWHDLLWSGRARQQEVEHRRRVEHIIDFLRLERYRKTPAGILPYGILKRVELGRALSMEPKILLLDEPAAGLNQEETEDMARFVLDIKEELGVAQLLIEHELHFVLDLADAVHVLDFGQTLTSGTPDAVRRDPKLAEAYLGSHAASFTSSPSEASP